MILRTLALPGAAIATAVLSTPATAASSGPGAAPPQAPCTSGLAVAADEESLTRRDDGTPFPPGRIKAFLPQAAAAFRAAADELCAAGAIKPTRFAKFHRLLIRSGSGAVDSAVYDDKETLGPDTLVFEWVFSEEDLKVPDKSDIQAALRCWNEWDEATCSERLP